jgi:hypothetical protein
VILLEELRHVDDEVADHRQTRQRTQDDRLFERIEVRETRQAILAIDVHRVRPADPFAAGAPKRQRIVFGFHFHQRLQEFFVGRFDFDRDVLHVRFFVLVRVVAIDAEMDHTVGHG